MATCGLKVVVVDGWDVWEGVSHVLLEPDECGPLAGWEPVCQVDERDDHCGTREDSAGRQDSALELLDRRLFGFQLSAG